MRSYVVLQWLGLVALCVGVLLVVGIGAALVVAGAGLLAVGVAAERERAREAA